MMYHCIPIGCSSPSHTNSHTKLLENRLDDALHTQIHQPEKNSEKRHGNHNNPGRRNHVLARGPGDLLHLHASVVDKLAHLRKRAGDFARKVRAHPALRFIVFHFYRLRRHKASSLPRSGLAPAPPFRFHAPAGLGARLTPLRALNSGRGGGIRTPIPGFGDRSPNRWTTPLNSIPVCPANPPKQKLFHFLVRRLLAARIAKLLSFQTLRMFLLVLRRGVVAVLAFAALQCNGLAHFLPSPPKHLPIWPDHPNSATGALQIP